MGLMQITEKLCSWLRWIYNYFMGIRTKTDNLSLDSKTEFVLFKEEEGKLVCSSCTDDEKQIWKFCKTGDMADSTGYLLKTEEETWQLVVNNDKVDLTNEEDKTQTWKIFSCDGNCRLQHLPSKKYLNVSEKGYLEMKDKEENDTVFRIADICENMPDHFPTKAATEAFKFGRTVSANVFSYFAIQKLKKIKPNETQDTRQQGVDFDHNDTIFT